MIKKRNVARVMPTIGFLIDKYLNVYWPTKKAGKHSTKVINSICKVINEFFSDLKINQINAHHIEEYVVYRMSKDIKNNTIRRELTTLISVINNGLKKGYIQKFKTNGFNSNEFFIAKMVIEFIKDNRPKTERRNLRPTFDQVDEILSAIKNQTVHAIIWCAVRLGYRRGELLSLKWIDYDSVNHEIRLNNSKTGEPRNTPLDSRLNSFFKQQMLVAINNNGKDNYKLQPIFKVDNKTIYNQWRAALIKLGYVDEDGKPLWVFHDLRRVAVRYLMEIMEYKEDWIRSYFTGHKNPEIFHSTYNVRNYDSFKQAHESITGIKERR